ncbi:MAG TPA: hypothetical protein VMW74_08275 [Nitrosopumilaceae archaeon]|nr:hypothetical protein [Nitrosopumilaceae archaeon]
MKTRAILGISLAAAFVLTISITAAMADIPGSMTVTEASSDGASHYMTVQDKVKQITEKQAPDLITFWAWAVQITQDAPSGTVLAVDAITIHHGVNDHQAFDDGADSNPTNKDIKSTPVQSFHPHKAYFDANGCIIGLESPKADFKVKHNTLVMTSSQTEAVAVATGTIGTTGHEACPLGLGITGTVTSPTGIPLPP